MSKIFETVYLALGSNLGERTKYIRKAIATVAGWRDVNLNRVSSLYETDPVGPQDQGVFLNAVAQLDVSAGSLEFLKRLLALESELGRVRTRHWGPRVIDLDLLLWGDRIINSERLIIPHQEMSNRAFVLVPMVEIAPKAVHSVLNRTMESLLEDLEGDEGVKVIHEGSGWSE